MSSNSSLKLTVERLNGGKPILAKITEHDWESRVVFNPGCVLIDDKEELEKIVSKLNVSASTRAKMLQQRALCMLLYRAQGAKTEVEDYTHSRLGLAVLTPELELIHRFEQPVLWPEYDFENLGVEDPRIIKMDERYYVFYTGYATGKTRNEIRICIASTTDFVKWEKHGLLKGGFNEIDNKNCTLFPEKIDGKYVLLHRPMEGDNAHCIHLAESDDILGMWKTKGVIMKPYPNSKFLDTWIGGGAPPLKLGERKYLLIYHIGNKTEEDGREYCLGIAVTDFNSLKPIVKRYEPIFRPETDYEITGDVHLGVNNVVFICGAYCYGEDIIFPYGGADSVVLGARIKRSEINPLL